MAVALVSLGLFWIPFLAHTQTFWGINFGGHGLETIVQNFDGLNYLAVAKTGYDPTLLATDFASFGNPPIYYAAHFPLYPLLVHSLDLVMNGPQAILASIVISNLLLALGLYMFFEAVSKNQRAATILACVALFFPARMMGVRGVASSEPLFIFLTLASLTMAFRGKHWWGAILGALAVLTRSPGILLFGGYGVAYLLGQDTWAMRAKRILPYLLMPISLGLLFGFYGLRYGSFWAYFSSSSELHPIFFPPLLIFSNTQRWITDMWREDIVYLYLLYGTGIYLYLKKIWGKVGLAELGVAGYGILYGLFLLLVAHRDLARYALPIAPIALLAFAPILTHKSARWLALLLIPIFLMSWQFVVANVQPVADWSSLL